MLRHAVQNCRWTVDDQKVTGEHVAAEQQIVLRAVKAAVPRRVARQVKHAQSAPERKFLSVAQKFINRARAVAEQKSSAGLQSPTPSRGARVRISPRHVSRLLGVRINFCAAPLLE